MLTGNTQRTGIYYTLYYIIPVYYIILEAQVWYTKEHCGGITFSLMFRSKFIIPQISNFKYRKILINKKITI